MNDRDRKRHERRRARQRAAAAPCQLPPVVYPVWWPVDATPEEAAGYAWCSVEKHHPYNAGVAEMARRRGEGGFLHIVVASTQTAPDDAGLVLSFCTVRWNTAVVLPGGLPGGRAVPDGPRMDATRTPATLAFTVHVEYDGEHGRRWAVTCDVRCEVDVGRLEQMESMARGGCDSILAIDGAAGGGESVEVAR